MGKGFDHALIKFGQERSLQGNGIDSKLTGAAKEVSRRPANIRRMIRWAGIPKEPVVRETIHSYANGHISPPIDFC
jgi:hypothetical protein